jgi:hypothetical protein
MKRMKFLVLLLCILGQPLGTIGCSSLTKAKSRSQLQVTQLKGEFIALLLNSEKDRGTFDVDDFVAKHNITNKELYEFVLRPLMDTHSNGIPLKDFRYKFQGFEPVGCFSDEITPIALMALEYLGTNVSLAFPADTPEGIGLICDRLYFLNTLPGAYEKQLTLVRFLNSDSEEDYAAACTYLIDTKIKMAWLLEEGRLVRTGTEKGVEWRRPEFRCPLYVLQEGDLCTCPRLTIKK